MWIWAGHNGTDGRQKVRFIPSKYPAISDLLSSLAAVLEIDKFAGKWVGVGKLRSEEGRNNFQHSARGSTTKNKKTKTKKWYVTSL